MPMSTNPLENMEMEEVPTAIADGNVCPMAPTKVPENSGLRKLSSVVFQPSSTSPSTSPPPAFHENAALCVRNAYKSYKKGTPVLNNFNMTVPGGSM